MQMGVHYRSTENALELVLKLKHGSQKLIVNSHLSLRAYITQNKGLVILLPCDLYLQKYRRQ